MLLSLLHFAVCRPLRLLAMGGKRDDAAGDLEILVLRHQLHVLERDRRPRLRRRDRILLATPEQKPDSGHDGEIVRVARMGGLINEYHRIAA